MNSHRRNHAPLRVPSATYRLQLSRHFTFRQAREIVAYLHDLGISDCYSSPFFEAAPDSPHGYDISNHNNLNPSIGTREEFDALVAELQQHQMGQVADFVPNHMGIASPNNKWWMDVLENGPVSQFAPYFDIDWHPLKEELENKVLLPILGDQYGRVLERGEFKLAFEEGPSFFVTTITNCRYRPAATDASFSPLSNSSPLTTTRSFSTSCRASSMPANTSRRRPSRTRRGSRSAASRKR